MRTRSTRSGLLKRGVLRVLDVSLNGVDDVHSLARGLVMCCELFFDFLAPIRATERACRR